MLVQLPRDVLPSFRVKHFDNDALYMQGKGTRPLLRTPARQTAVGTLSDLPPTDVKCVLNSLR